ELLLAVHDLDAHRDLVFALASDARRQHLHRGWLGRPASAGRPEDRSLHSMEAVPGSREAEARRAEVFDLSGVARDYLPDVVAGALAVPVASEPSTLRFAPDAYWRGEMHRLCDRPGILARLLEELTELGAEQILIVTAAPDARGPHSLSAPRLDGRGRLGQYLESAEAAAVRDALRLAAGPVERERAAGRPSGRI